LSLQNKGRKWSWLKCFYYAQSTTSTLTKKIENKKFGNFSLFKLLRNFQKNVEEYPLSLAAASCSFFARLVRVKTFLPGPPFKFFAELHVR